MHVSSRNATTDIVLVSTLCSQRVFSDLFVKHGVKGSNATQKFFRLFAQALSMIPGARVTVHSLRPISHWKQRWGWWRRERDREGGVTYNAFPLLNAPIVRNVLACLSVFVIILFHRKALNARTAVVCDYLCFSVNLGAIAAARLRGFVTIAVATDYPGVDVFTHNAASRLRSRLTTNLKYSAYVCVTSALNERVNAEGAPSLITVGVVDAEECMAEASPRQVDGPRTIVYAGGLYEMYGIRLLIDAFRRIEARNVQLLLYGTGPLVDDIVGLCELDPRIEYRGVVQNAELLRVIRSATLLVNPRPSGAEYTLYSFPSKNLEFMCTGTPLLTTRLAGMPSSHESCVLFIENETAEGVAEAIDSALQSTQEFLEDLGAKARNVMLAENTAVHLADRLHALLKRVR